jgi:hypothetical protein
VRKKFLPYSITSSAATCTVCGNVMPSEIPLKVDIRFQCKIDTLGSWPRFSPGGDIANIGESGEDEAGNPQDRSSETRPPGPVTGYQDKED